ncbi:MAG: glycosyltransferase family 4 protein [Deltaproteobacteria bacterium]|nr:glycosyltransferase family 4 protein [Deltaproteobacteria bacterium]
MHIGVVTTSWPHTHDPTAGAFAYALTHALALRGHTHTVLFAQAPSSAGSPHTLSSTALFPLDYGARDHNTLFYGAGAPHRLRARSGELARSLALGLRFTYVITRAVQRHLRDCDALISHFALPSALAAAVHRAGRPHHAIVHGSDQHALAHMPRALQRAIAQRCTSIQFVHPSLRDGLDPSWAGHPHAWDHPMGAEPLSAEIRATRESTRASLNLQQDHTLVLCVARCVEAKGLEVLVRAMQQLPTSTQCVVVGDGPLRAALAAQSQGRVHFVGAQQAHTRDRWLAAADLFVLPSLQDSAPTALIEAMCAGLPCIATHVGGIPWIAGDAVLLVPPGCPDALRDAMRALSQDPGARSERAQRGRERGLAWRWRELARRTEYTLSDALNH